MEHKPFLDLKVVADVTPAESRASLSREERLARLAEVLERDPHRRLRPLQEIEWKLPHERRALRTDESPLTVAYEDPVLRTEGLAGDRLGDVMDFFQLSEHEAHVAFCSCHLGSSFKAKVAATRVRGLMNGTSAPSEGRSGLRALASVLFGR
jgi:hypothetical protein